MLSKNCEVILGHIPARQEVQEVKVWESLRPAIADGKLQSPDAAGTMSNAMWFLIGDRVEKDTGGECLGDPPSQRLPTRSSGRTEMIRLIMECHEEAVFPQATQLTVTLVGVAMCSVG